MVSGFRYFAGGMMLVIVVFAGISLWPFLEKIAAPAAQPVANPVPAQPANTLSAVPAPLPRTPAKQTFPKYEFTEDTERKPIHPGWLYTQQATVLRVKPGGQGFPPISLNNAPLIIATGTRVWPRQTEGDWVMIKSPGGRLGWVEATELDKSRPYIPYRD